MTIVFTTFKDKEEAYKLGKKLLNKKMIACYNLVPIESSYWWKKKIVEENEILMIIKTNKRFDKVEKFINEHHNYDTPEIVGIDTKLIGKKYLKWLKFL